MTEPVTSYTIMLADKTTVTVVAQSFETIGRDIVFSSERGQTVAAFADGQWITVMPVVAP